MRYRHTNEDSKTIGETKNTLTPPNQRFDPTQIQKNDPIPISMSRALWLGHVDGRKCRRTPSVVSGREHVPKPLNFAIFIFNLIYLNINKM